MITALAFHDGHVAEIGKDAIAAEVASRADGGFVWVHIQSNGQTESFLDELSFDLPPTVRRALTAVETRPRCEPMESGVLVNMRAPAAQGKSAHDGGDLLVSVRLWAEAGLLLSVSFRPSTVVPLVEDKFRIGALQDPGDVIIAMATASAEALDPVVAALGDQLDDLESDLGPGTAFSERRLVTQLRTLAIGYRRFVNPQRMAFERLSQLPLDWLDDGERAAVREAADRFARMTEELESVRERAAVLHEELTDLRAEKMDARSLQIAIVAMIFLPLTFITGLLGMNVEGIPFSKAHWAFWGVVAFCVAVAALVGLWFIIRRWSER
jgi:zinc transporter